MREGADGRMNKTRESFGRRCSRVSLVTELLALERADGCSDTFAEIDSLVGRLLVRSLCGEHILDLSQNDLYVNSVSLLTLEAAERKLLKEWFAVEQQQSRGMWTLPEKASLRAGYTNLRWAYNRAGRFGTNLAAEARGPVKLASSPDAVFHWAVLENLFESLCLPFELRGTLTGELTREEQTEKWAEVDNFYQALGFEVSEELRVMRYGGGWHRLNSAAQHAAKLRLLESLGDQARVEMGMRYRAQRILPLVASYYKKAKKDHRVKRKQVLNKALERALCGYWGGDWLAFLDYIGEDPHPEEQIVTALPKVKPMVTNQTNRVEEVAAAKGLPIEVVKSIAASYWQKTEGESPVERRVKCLEQYWRVYDQLHARQTTRKKSLWGLVSDNRYFNFSFEADRQDFNPRLYRELLPAELLAEIESLWSGTMNPKYPDRIVTEPFPHQVLTETFGPALRFWDGCALTAWFLCEGPYSRTDMSGLAHYHRSEIAELEEMQTPIDPHLFTDLIEAEKRLGPPKEVEDESSTTDYGMFSVKISVGGGTKRSGFERLRDAVTRHRRAWSEKHLETYLKMRWEREITEAGRAYNLLVQNKGGRVPTAKQFAKAATPATNHWFGGDISGLYGSLREKCPVEPQRTRRMPEDVYDFAQRLYEAFPHDKDGQNYTNYIDALAGLGVRYVQMEEALGRLPEMNELGKRFKDHSRALKDDVGEAWEIFIDTIQRVRAGTLSHSAPDVAMQPRSADITSPFEKLEKARSDEAALVNDVIILPPRSNPKIAQPSSPEPKSLRQSESRKKSWWRKLLGT